jgi:hypothetical protein
VDGALGHRRSRRPAADPQRQGGPPRPARRAAAAAPRRPPPEGPEQTALAALWRRVLKTETIDAGRSFAEHGGHSLDALTASALAPEVLGRALSAAELLDGATLADLAERRKTATPSPDDADLLLLPGIGGEGLVLRPLAARLDRLRVRLGDLPRGPSVGEIADRLLAETPAAPILGGWSMGGVVAFAIARRRTRRGDAPAGGVLLVAFPAAALPGSRPATTCPPGCGRFTANGPRPRRPPPASWPNWASTKPPPRR